MAKLINWMIELQSVPGLILEEWFFLIEFFKQAGVLFPEKIEELPQKSFMFCPKAYGSQKDFWWSTQLIGWIPPWMIVKAIWRLMALVGLVAL